MKNFNIHRFGWLLKHDCGQNARKYLAFAAGAFFAHFCGQMGAWSLVWKSPTPVPVELIAGLGQVAAKSFVLVSMFLVWYGMCVPMSMLYTKERRIAYLMVPATGFEKFLSKLLLAFVGSLLVNFVAFVGADLLRMLVFLISGTPIGSALPYVWQAAILKFHALTDNIGLFSGEGIGHLIVCLQLLIFGLLIPACFFLGSVLFRKHSFVKTAVSLIFISVVSGWTVTYCFSPRLIDTLSDRPILVSSSLNLLFLVLCVWIAYRRFVRMPVVRRKWFKLIW